MFVTPGSRAKRSDFNKVGFGAYLAANQTGIAAATFTKVALALAKVQRGSFDFVNSRWIPQRGLIHIGGFTWFVAGVNQSGNPNYYCAIYKNGAQLAIGTGTPQVGWTITAIAQAACTDWANGSDYYELFCYGDSTGTLTLDSNPAHTYMYGAVL